MSKKGSKIEAVWGLLLFMVLYTVYLMVVLKTATN